jgi:serine/threonine protein kinase/formylglycine-generating enzyme required for sulfatase activity
MRVQCPNCLCDLDVVPAESVLEVKCPSCGSQVDVSSHAETVAYQPPQLGRLGPFDLVAHIGRGHFGDVYKARDSRLERLVAVKVPRTDDLIPAAREAFFREARTAARLRHANIVTVHEVNTAGEKIYIASELIDGVNLADLISGRQLDPRRAARIAAGVADALHHAHENDVVHRDLKPRNIMLDERDEPHLLDFGLAKQSASEFTITSEGDILGTPAYMAPEQARGQAGSADRRTDVYSLGVTLYEMLTGRRPFVGQVRGLIFQILHDDPTPPRALDTAIPRDLETICLKAMAKRPEARYATAGEMARDLRRFLADEPIRARRAGPVERALKWCRRNPVVAASASLATAASLALSVLAYAYASAETGPPKRLVELDVRLAQGPFQASGDPRATSPIRLVAWRLDHEGNPLVDRPTTALASPPLRLKLDPGDYLVVAVDDQSGRFHEVFRRVPALDEKQGGGYRHQRWQFGTGGAAELAPITLPLPGVTSGMAMFQGANGFAMGDARSMELPVHHRRLGPFFLDTHEVTIGEFQRASIGSLPPQLAGVKPDQALRGVTYDQALAWAEHCGKTLPTETQYEFAATGGATLAYPWGDSPDVAADVWPIGAADDASPHDTNGSSPAVRGLYSNVAEWTSTWMQFYPVLRSMGTPVPLTYSEYRVVRGAPPSVIEGRPPGPDHVYGPRNRLIRSRASATDTIGFRCARSVRPHLSAADFERVIRLGE